MIKLILLLLLVLISGCEVNDIKVGVEADTPIPANCLSSFNPEECAKREIKTSQC